MQAIVKIVKIVKIDKIDGLYRVPQVSLLRPGIEVIYETAFTCWRP